MLEDEGSVVRKDASAWRGLLGVVVDVLQDQRQTLRKVLHFASKVKRLGGGAKAIDRFRLDADALKAAYRAALGPR
ncbi:MAG: hypothetical protein JKY65_26805 [Planctomycetes bacterium]|nr:hypothetical protein [Planctomycetota bacterium]